MKRLHFEVGEALSKKKVYDAENNYVGYLYGGNKANIWESSSKLKYGAERVIVRQGVDESVVVPAASAEAKYYYFEETARIGQYAVYCFFFYGDFFNRFASERLSDEVIPTLTEGELQRRSEAVTQCVKQDDGAFYEARLPENLRSTAYTWSPKERKIRDIRDEPELWLEYPTFHQWAYYGFFKPSMDETLSQLPSSVFGAGKIMIRTEPYSVVPMEVIYGNYHLARTFVYKKAVDGEEDENEGGVQEVEKEGGGTRKRRVREDERVEEDAEEEDADENGATAGEAEEEVCMICLDRSPNTMVLPCEHCVVCKECSIQLRTTPDQKICVQCRREITHILE